MATSVEVARLAGVSRATVSRVLNGSARISEDAKRRVYVAITTLGYEPDVVAQSLVRQRSRTIALGLLDREDSLALSSLGETANYFYIEMLRCIEQEAEGLGYDLLLSSYPRGKAPERYIRSLQMRRIAGTIMLAIAPTDPRVRSLLQAGIPTVFIDTVSRGEHAVCVRSNHIDGARQLAEHLLALGHRRIAFIGGPAMDLAAMERLLGFQQTLASTGILLDPDLVRQSGWNTEEAYQTAHELLHQRRDFTAIVAGSDLMAIGVLHALHEQNVRIPQDISLAGFDNVILSQYTTPSLTTVCQEREAMGREAMQRLMALIEGKETSSLVVPTSLVVRQSTGPVSG
jgi:LacI family transcriptional regulator